MPWSSSVYVHMRCSRQSYSFSEKPWMMLSWEDLCSLRHMNSFTMYWGLPLMVKGPGTGVFLLLKASFFPFWHVSCLTARVQRISEKVDPCILVMDGSRQEIWQICLLEISWDGFPAPLLLLPSCGFYTIFLVFVGHLCEDKIFTVPMHSTTISTFNSHGFHPFRLFKILGCPCRAVVKRIMLPALMVGCCSPAAWVPLEIVTE